MRSKPPGMYHPTWRPGTRSGPPIRSLAAGVGSNRMTRSAPSSWSPVPTYQMVDRASKYAVLFLALSFLTYFLFELISGVSIHFVQYGLLGASIALFSLLL